MIEKLSDTKVIIGIVAVIGFIMYNRSKQQEMQMLLKMKELEMKAAMNKARMGDSDDNSTGPSGETKKKK